MRSSLLALTLPLAACATVPPSPPIAEREPRSATVTSTVTLTEAEAASMRETLARIDYPQTRRMDLVETQFGTPVPDPYRWLENDVRTDPEARAWVEAQNAVTNAFLATLPARGAFKARMTELYDYERFGIPERKGGRYFYTRNDGLQNQSV